MTTEMDLKGIIPNGKKKKKAKLKSYVPYDFIDTPFCR